MKKHLIIILSCLLSLSLISCGSKSEDSEINTNEEIKAVETSETPEFKNKLTDIFNNTEIEEDLDVEPGEGFEVCSDETFQQLEIAYDKLEKEYNNAVEYYEKNPDKKTEEIQVKLDECKEFIEWTSHLAQQETYEINALDIIDSMNDYSAYLKTIKN